MKTNLLFLLLVLCANAVSGQVYERFNLELSSGIMRCQNKEEPVSGTFSSGFQSSRSNLKYESYIMTLRHGINLGFNISNHHAISVGYSYGTVGSTITGIVRTVDDIGFRRADIFQNSKNITKYSSINFMYSFIIPIHKYQLITSLGLQKQNNGFEDLRLFRQGIIFDNYNTSLSIGFGLELYSNIDIIPKITFINSYNNQNYNVAESLFVPFQAGVEIGLRLKFEKN